MWCSPSTGEVLRHGPALMATARDNKEVPIIKAVFQNFDKNGGFAQPPMSPFVGIQIPEKIMMVKFRKRYR